MNDYKELNHFEVSAIIGYWRMGVDESIIAAIMEVSLKQVFSVIKTYQTI